MLRARLTTSRLRGYKISTDEILQEREGLRSQVAGNKDAFYPSILRRQQTGQQWNNRNNNITVANERETIA